MDKRKKVLSILLIPEGEKQTYTFKISYLLLKVMLIFSLVFFGVLTIGAVSYWKLAGIALDYERVSKLNQKLLSDNLIINDLVERFNKIQDTDTRIRNLFGEKIDFSENESKLEFTKYPLAESQSTQYSAEELGGTVNFGHTSDLISSFPSYVPVEGQITNKYFSDNSALTGHSGIDIVAKELSVIKAAGDGIVVFSNWTYDSGNMVVIDHLNGYITIYKHNASLSVTERQKVFQGQPIALLGNSGNSTAPHLHFEIWKDFKAVDPLTILPIQ